MDREKRIAEIELLGIGLFIEPIILFSVALNKHISQATYSSLIFSLWALPAVSLAVFVLVMLGVALRD